jgi:putative toxin-antitoxin system antitoxin component (TIGR02293 family)
MTVNENNKVKQLLKELLAFSQKGNESKLTMAEEGVSVYGFPTDKFFMVNLIKEGLPYSIFNLIHDLAPFSDTEWANLLDVSTKTMLRYKQSQKKFRSIHSEKILEMTEVTIIGLEVFGNMSKFKQWLYTPSYALGNLKPVNLITDSYGKELVIAELSNINHGIFA